MSKRKKVSNRDTSQIQKWMIDAGLTVTAIATDLGMKMPTVSSTIHGYANNRKVLRLLLGHGCPKEYLDLPERLRDGEPVERRVRKRQAVTA